MSTDRLDEEHWYGYRLVSRTGRSDSTYHESASASVAIHGPDGAVLHTVDRSSRSSHQLKKAYRAPAPVAEEALEEARAWVLANRPDAAARRDAEAETERQARLAAHDGDLVAYLRSLSLELSPTDVGRALGLGSARRVNALLAEWGLQREQRGAYVGADAAHGRMVGGTYPAWRWNAAGLFAIWAAAEAHGMVEGGERALVERVLANTIWLPKGAPAGGPR